MSDSRFCQLWQMLAAFAFCFRKGQVFACNGCKTHEFGASFSPLPANGIVEGGKTHKVVKFITDPPISVPDRKQAGGTLKESPIFEATTPHVYLNCHFLAFQVLWHFAIRHAEISHVKLIDGRLSDPNQRQSKTNKIPNGLRTWQLTQLLRKHDLFFLPFFNRTIVISFVALDDWKVLKL